MSNRLNSAAASFPKVNSCFARCYPYNRGREQRCKTSPECPGNRRRDWA
ncbi:hypothetical protein Murka_0076 [Xanthomonas phage Murka]|nr:hypothetical protein Murka_0076 [Xanthomonas phage Murka]